MWRSSGTGHHAQDWLRIKGGTSKKREEQMETDQRGVVWENRSALQE